MTIPPLVRKVLALPEPKPDYDDEPEAGAPRPAARKAGSQASPWETVDETKGQETRRKAGMVVLWCAVAFFVLLGIRSLFVGGQAAQPAPAAATSEFPTGEAQAVADRFITNYLTLPGNDQDAQDARQKALAQDTPLDLSNTWNGDGSQQVLTVLPGQVEQLGAGTAQVRLLVQVADAASTPAATASPSTTTPSKPAKHAKGKDGKTKKSDTKKEKPAPPTTPPAQPAATAPKDATWLNVVVPVQMAGGRVVVSGAPVFTSSPKAGAVNPPEAPADTDSALSDRTRGTVTAFFQAWAGDDGAALDAATAPGARMAPLGSAVTFEKLVDWRVYAAKDHGKPQPSSAPTPKPSQRQRQASAVVAWRLPSGATLTQTYTVTLRTVTGSGITDWRVAQATAGTDTEGAQ